MPRYSLSPSSFPFTFHDILRRVQSEDAFVSFDTVTEAKAARMRFYGLKRALRSHVGEPQWDALSKVAEDVSVGLNGTTLSFRWRASAGIDPMRVEFVPRVGPASILPGEPSRDDLIQRAEAALQRATQKDLTNGGDSPIIQSDGVVPSILGNPPTTQGDENG